MYEKSRGNCCSYFVGESRKERSWKGVKLLRENMENLMIAEGNFAQLA